MPAFAVGEALFLRSEPCADRLPLLSRAKMKRKAAEFPRQYFDVDRSPVAVAYRPSAGR